MSKVRAILRVIGRVSGTTDAPVIERMIPAIVQANFALDEVTAGDVVEILVRAEVVSTALPLPEDVGGIG